MKYSFIIVVLLFICGCNKNESPTEGLNSSSGILPLKIGNKWIMNVTNYDSTGAVSSTSIDTISIISDTTINSEKWYYSDFWGLVTNRSDGLWISMFSDQFIFFKFPISANDSYTTVMDIPVKVISVNIQVSVPSGLYTCYQYEMSLPDPISTTNSLYIDTYLAPGKGLIKYENYQKKPDGQMLLTSREELKTLILN